jgi:chromosome partitioning protein
MAKKRRIITLAATKGGVGKTTLSAALAVRAAEDSDRVALIDDDNGQASLERWWKARRRNTGDPNRPALLECEATATALGLIEADGWEWIFVDTAPGRIESILESIKAADLVIIPLRPSAVDVLAIDQTVEMCQAFEREFGFVLNQVVDLETKLYQNSRAALRQMGRVIDAPITFRQAYVTAMTIGRTGPEVERGDRCRNEIDALWSAVKRLVK